MESVYLSGSDDVARAASTMRTAAAEMQQAAATIDGALDRHRLFLDDWLSRFAATLETKETP